MTALVGKRSWVEFLPYRDGRDYPYLISLPPISGIHPASDVLGDVGFLASRGSDLLPMLGCRVIVDAPLIPTLPDKDPSRRFHGAFGKERLAWRCLASRGGRDAVRKSCETAVPVADSARRRASKSLADAAHRRRHFSYPTGPIRDLHESLLGRLGISARSRTGPAPSARLQR
jgi:hypothetical protein